MASGSSDGSHKLYFYSRCKSNGTLSYFMGEIVYSMYPTSSSSPFLSGTSNNSTSSSSSSSSSSSINSSNRVMRVLTATLLNYPHSHLSIVYLPIYIHTYIHTYMHTSIHTCIHTYSNF